MNNWFTCAEFNAKTGANHHKHEARRQALVNIARRQEESERRRRNRILALDCALVGTACAALGTLASFLILRLL